MSCTVCVDRIVCGIAYVTIQSNETRATFHGRRSIQEFSGLKVSEGDCFDLHCYGDGSYKFERKQPIPLNVDAYNEFCASIADE